MFNLLHAGYVYMLFMGGSRGGGAGGTDPSPPENHKNIGFLCNTGPDHPKNHKAAKAAFNVGPSSARQRNAILMAFRWRADDRTFVAVFRSCIPSSTKIIIKKVIKCGPPLTKLSGFAHSVVDDLGKIPPNEP